MDINLNLRETILKALQSLKVKINLNSIKLEHPVIEVHGDYSCNIAMVNFPKTKGKYKSPWEYAEQIVKNFEPEKKLKDYIKKIEVAGPGFINFYLSDKFLLDELNLIFNIKDKYGRGDSLKGKKIMVEYSQPNPFKVFHIGHLRGTILGDVVCRLLENQGANIIRTNYQGDVGMHIAKCLWAFQKVNPDQYPKDLNKRMKLIADCYVMGAKAFEENEGNKEEIVTINKKIYSKEDPRINKLWDLGKKWSLEKFHEIFKRLDTKFDREYMESEMVEDCLDYIDKALKKGILKKSQGAIVFDGSGYNLETRVFLNSKGLPTYEGKELGLAHKEFTDFGELDRCIHNVAIEQKSFFEVTFKVEELLNPKLFKGKQYHNAYEFVGLKKGKMSSRKGQVILGEAILDETKKEVEKILEKKSKVEDKEFLAEILGTGATKYSFLKISPFKYLAFDLKESINTQGDSGPYLQYTYARCRSVLRKAGEIKQKPINLPKNFKINKEELEILKWLYRFPEVAKLAAENYVPNLLCEYLNTLAQRFNTFYNKHSIVNAEKESQKEFRLILTEGTSQVIKSGLNLLGIKSSEKV